MTDRLQPTGKKSRFANDGREAADTRSGDGERQRVVRRYRAQLAAGALDADASSLLSQQSFGLVRMSGATGVGDPANPQRNVPPDVESRFEDETAALRRRLGYDAVRLDGATVEVPKKLCSGPSAPISSASA